jgi:predicted peptidase
MAIAPVLKTGGRKPLGVRIPRPPCVPSSTRLFLVAIGAVTAAAVACARPAVVVPTTPTSSFDDPKLPPIDGFVARRFGRDSSAAPYRLFIPPGYTPNRKYPVVVWLHGAFGSGTDNLANVSGDQIPGTRLWTTPANQAAHPAFVVVPQSPFSWMRGTGNRLNLEIVPPILEALTREFSVDTTRFYLAGQSDGGGGAWELLRMRPGLFAAAILVCPGPRPDKGGVRDPVWIFVGDQDQELLVMGARQLRDSINARGGPIRYVEYPGMGHDIWDRVFKEPDLANWLFAHRR